MTGKPGRQGDQKYPGAPARRKHKERQRQPGGRRQRSDEAHHRMHPIADGARPTDRHAADEPERPRRTRNPCASSMSEWSVLSPRRGQSSVYTSSSDCGAAKKGRGSRLSFAVASSHSSEQQRQHDQPWTGSEQPWEIDANSLRPIAPSNASPIAAMQPASRLVGPTSPASGHRSAKLRPPAMRPPPAHRTTTSGGAVACPIASVASSLATCSARVERPHVARMSTQTRSAN